jgi:DNA-3-methyladenine glycosylase II
MKGNQMNKEIILTAEHKGIQFLSQADPELAKLITLIGDFTINIREDRFCSLVKSIIGQQLSVKAAATIVSRFQTLLNDKINPTTIENIDNAQLREVGISKQKISYIRDLCEKVKTKQVDLYGLDVLEDPDVIKLLTTIKGIGKWTAEMFLIFSLGRENILSLDDAGLHRACKWLYGVDKKEDGKKLLQEKANRWIPYCSFASFYLWEAINKGYVDSFDGIGEALMSVKR